MQRQFAPGRGAGQGRGAGRIPVPPPEADLEDALADGMLDEDSQDISATRERRPRAERAPRRKPASMMSTISDDSSVLSGKSGRGSIQAMRGQGKGRGRGRGRGAEPSDNRRGQRQGTGSEMQGLETVEDEEGEEEAEGRVPHPEDGMGMDEEPEWHVALENGTLAKLPLDSEGSAYVLDPDGITVKELWDSLDLPQLREVSVKLSSDLIRFNQPRFDLQHVALSCCVSFIRLCRVEYH